jgi:MFS family permease
MMMPGDPVLRMRTSALVGVLLIAVLASWRLMPARVAPADAPATEVSGARVMERVRGVVGDAEGGAGQPRTIGSEAHARAVQYVVDELKAMGVTAQLQRGEMPNRFKRTESVQLVNIIAPLGVGPEEADEYVAIAAHIDSVPGATGAGDDALGVASALEVARALRARAPTQQGGRYPREVVLVITDGEELGLLGAELFCREHPLAERIGAVVNLDNRGTSGPAFIFETGPDTTALAEIMASRVPHPRTTSVAATIYDYMPNGTDFTVFREAGMTGFNVACIGSPRNYHQPSDTPDNVDPLSAQHMADTALALVEGLASAPKAASPAPQSAWFDLLGFGVAHLPIAWMQPGALMALLLTLFSAIIALRCRWIRWSGIMIGIGAAVAAIALAALAGWGATNLARATLIDNELKGIARQQSWIWPPGYLWISAGMMLLGAVIALGLRSLALRTRQPRMPRTTGTLRNPGSPSGADPLSTARQPVFMPTGRDPEVNARWVHVLVALGIWGALALAVAIVAPGASVIFVLPALAGSIALAAGALGASRMVIMRPTIGFAARAAVCAMITAALMWIPLEPALADAFGLSMLSVAAVRGALLALLLP